MDEENPESHFASKDLLNLINLEEDDPPPGIVTLPSSEEAAPGIVVVDPVLGNVVRQCGHLLTKAPFSHESLLVDRKDKKLTRSEKRLAERSYDKEKLSRISYTRPSYAAFYPKESDYGGGQNNYNNATAAGVFKTAERMPGGMFAPLLQNGFETTATTSSSSSFQPMTFYANNDIIPPLPLPLPPAGMAGDGGGGPNLNGSFDSYFSEGSVGYGEIPEPLPETIPNSQQQKTFADESLPNVGISEVPPILNNRESTSSNGNPLLLQTGNVNPRRFPVEALQRQGVGIKEFIVPKDMKIPTSLGQPPIALRRGQKAMVIRTPKGVYLRMGEKIIKIRLPDAVIAGLTGGGGFAEGPFPPTICPSNPGEVVTLSDSDSGDEDCGIRLATSGEPLHPICDTTTTTSMGPSNTKRNEGPVRELMQFVRSTAASMGGPLLAVTANGSAAAAGGLNGTATTPGQPSDENGTSLKNYLSPD